MVINECMACGKMFEGQGLECFCPSCQTVHDPNRSEAQMTEEIKKAITEGKDFLAHKLLLILSGEATEENANFVAWQEGPEGADRRIEAFKRGYYEAD